MLCLINLILYLCKKNNMMQASDSVVIIPTYNEKENIENIIRAVFGLKKMCPHSYY